MNTQSTASTLSLSLSRGAESRLLRCLDRRHNAGLIGDYRLSLLGALLMLTAGAGVGCGGVGGGGAGGGGSGNASGNVGSGSVGAGQTTGAGQQNDQCYQGAEGNWSLQLTKGGGLCHGYDPIQCDVTQDGCSVTLACDHFGPPETVTIDKAGVTSSVTLGIGDGVVVNCHAEFSLNGGATPNPQFAMTMICEGMGVSCEFGETQFL